LESVIQHREALAATRRLHGAADHADVSAALAALGGVLSASRWPGDLAESALLLRRALEMTG
jgi:hypothetical protein